MTTFTATSPHLLKRIDALTIRHHLHLTPSDEIYYCEEYINRQGYSHSPTNQLILNYKMSMQFTNTNRGRFKRAAIHAVAEKFRTLILQTVGLNERIQKALLVPIPPSKAISHKEYDDRNLQMLRIAFPTAQIHELIQQKESRESLHKSNKRDVAMLQENYQIHMPTVAFEEIWLFDDILRNGTHYRAICNVLQEHFPACRFAGFFVARSITLSPVPQSETDGLEPAESFELQKELTLSKKGN